MTHTMIPLSAIRIDGGTQPRKSLNEDVVADYAEAIDSLPPVTVYFDGSEYWLADGFHRYHAHRKVGRERIAASGTEGTRRDAVLHSVGANHGHGLRRSNDDKRRSVETMLADYEWTNWSDNKIAACCAVSATFVGNVRRSLSTVESDDAPTERTYTTKSGKTATMKTGGIGKAKKPKKAAKPVEKTEPAKPEPAPAKPKKGEPNIESLQAENAELREELQQARDNARELAALLESYDSVTAGEHEAAKEMNRLRGMLRTVEATRDQWMTTASECRREVKALQSKLKKAGVK